MSEAILNIRVRADGVDEASSKLDQLDGAAGKAERSVKSLSVTASLIRGALGGMLAAFSIGAVGRMADEWSDLNARVNLATGSVEKGTAVMSRLHQMANATYSSLRTTTEAFIANSSTLKALGKSTQQQIDYTEALNNALVVSVAKGQVAASVQDALAKAMALGALKGDQLNTVIANGGKVVELIAEKLGVSTLEVRKLGTEGKITGDLIYSALVGNMEKLREEAEKMPATLGDAWQRMSTNAFAFIGTLDQLSGSSSSLAQVLLSLADNIDRLIVYGGVAAVAFGTVYVGAMAAAAIATGGLSGALLLLQRALMASGVGLIVVAVGELIYQLIQARKASNDWGEAFSKVVQRIKTLTEGLKWTYYAMVDTMKAAWSRLMAYMVKSTEDAMRIIYAKFGVTFSGFGDAAANLLEKGTQQALNAADQFTIAGEFFEKAFAKFEQAGSGISLGGDGSKGFGGSLGEAGGKGKGSGKDEKSSAAEKLANDMEQRLEALKQAFMTEEETVLGQYAKDLETLQWHLDQKKITEQEYLEWKTRVNREHEQEMQAIRLQGYSAALSATGDLMGALAQVVGSNNDKMLRAQKIFGAASALVDTYIGSAKALTLPFPANFAAAAAIMAKGLGLVAAIKSGSSTGGGGGYGGGTTQAAAPQQNAPMRQMARIDVHGEVFNREQVIGLISKINDVQKDGHVISWQGA